MGRWKGYDLVKAGGAGAGAPAGLAGLAGQGNRLISYADPALGVVYVVGRGLWNETIVDDHFAELSRTAAFVRRRVPWVRVLVDLSAAAIQSAAIAGRIKFHTKAIWTEHDRIAVIIPTALAGKRPDDAPEPPNQATFQTLAEARAWLGLNRTGLGTQTGPVIPVRRAIAADR